MKEVIDNNYKRVESTCSAVEDKELQHILYKKYYKDVFRTAYYIVRDKEIAKDLTNEAFLKAFTKIHTLNDITKFKQWICTIASNLAKTYIAKQKKLVFSEHVEVMQITKETPEDIVLDRIHSHEAKESVKKALEQLDPNSKEVILLRYYHNLSYKDLSTTLAIKEGTVKSRIKRAKNKLYKLLSLGGE
ncbi:MAG: RNA polymerase sigma factor [Clostridiaceae bacterium]|nr:RNA polymerase sigma factor [Clostridiaceae bacterium]